MRYIVSSGQQMLHVSDICHSDTFSRLVYYILVTLPRICFKNAPQSLCSVVQPRADGSIIVPATLFFPLARLWDVVRVDFAFTDQPARSPGPFETGSSTPERSAILIAPSTGKFRRGLLQLCPWITPCNLWWMRVSAHSKSVIISRTDRS